MAILVTGASGYIGSFACVRLLGEGFGVVGIDNFSNSGAEVVERINELAPKKLRFYEADLRDAAALDKIFKAERIDCVMHFAGLKAVGVSVSKPLEYYGNNINAAISLCECMDRHDTGAIVFSSSATVYDGANEMPLTEDSKTGGCTNPYGWTKFMCEQIIADIARAKGWTASIFRYFNVIGAHESGRIGDDPSGTPNNLMPYITQVAVGRLECLPLNGTDYPTPDGTCIRDYIHISDLIDGHIAAVKNANKNAGVNFYNLGTGRGTSNLELIETFEQINGVRVPYRATKRRPGDLAVTYADASKARRELGWSPKKSVEDMCADAWRWQKNNPEGYGRNAEKP
ncbi:MAG: UDP-glucose 4-epimerase GalE [Defluviitaleaceae bacterium]|nr:UDP-glucose 4-epimerase GalE [Defluviitaleaceae bacterium]